MSGEPVEKQEKNESIPAPEEVVGAIVVQLSKEDFEHAIEKGITFVSGVILMTLKLAYLC